MDSGPSVCATASLIDCMIKHCRNLVTWPVCIAVCTRWESSLASNKSLRHRTTPSGILDLSGEALQADEESNLIMQPHGVYTSSSFSPETSALLKKRSASRGETN